MTISNNKDWRHDLEFGEDSEHWFKELFGDTIEIKTERDIWATTGNIAVETHDTRKGKPSGINTTEAKYQLHVFQAADDKLAAIILRTDVLKEIIEDDERTLHPMGDKDADGSSAHGYLIRTNEALNKLGHIGRRIIDGKSRS
tara:strand:+ start:553 stop:981 length:429 start_codon:yes stop_codon:yes gene_type:complete